MLTVSVTEACHDQSVETWVVRSVSRSVSMVRILVADGQ